MQSEPFETQLEQIRQLLSLLQGEIALLEESYRSSLATLRADDLTGLLRREAFLIEFECLSRRAFERGQKVGVVVIDIDHFKSINDRYGHSAGDAVIRQVAGQIRNRAGHEGLAARWGGEEFVLALVGSESQILSQAEQLRTQIQNQQISFSSTLILRCTVSVGVKIESPRKGTHPDLCFEQVFSQADAALYEAKESGRNQVRAA